MHKGWWGIEEGPYCFPRLSVKCQGHEGQNKSPIFHPNLVFPDCNSSLNSPMAMRWCTNLKLHRRVALLFFNIIRQISRSPGTKNRRFWPEFGVSRTCNSSFTWSMATNLFAKVEVAQRRCPIDFQGYRQFFTRVAACNSSLNSLMVMKWFTTYLIRKRINLARNGVKHANSNFKRQLGIFVSNTYEDNTQCTSFWVR